MNKARPNYIRLVETPSVSKPRNVSEDRKQAIATLSSQNNAFETSSLIGPAKRLRVEDFYRAYGIKQHQITKLNSYLLEAGHEPSVRLEALTPSKLLSLVGTEFRGEALREFKAFTRGKLYPATAASQKLARRIVARRPAIQTSMVRRSQLSRIPSSRAVDSVEAFDDALLSLETDPRRRELQKMIFEKRNQIEKLKTVASGFRAAMRHKGKIATAAGTVAALTAYLGGGVITIPATTLLLLAGSGKMAKLYERMKLKGQIGALRTRDAVAGTKQLARDIWNGKDDTLLDQKTTLSRSPASTQKDTESLQEMLRQILDDQNQSRVVNLQQRREVERALRVIETTMSNSSRAANLGNRFELAA